MAQKMTGTSDGLTHESETLKSIVNRLKRAEGQLHALVDGGEHDEMDAKEVERLFLSLA